MDGFDAVSEGAMGVNRVASDLFFWDNRSERWPGRLVAAEGAWETTD